MIVVAIIGLLAAIAIPNFVKARTTSQQNACINNLRLIDSSKQQWALEQRQAEHRFASRYRFAALPGSRFFQRRDGRLALGGFFAFAQAAAQLDSPMRNHAFKIAVVIRVRWRGPLHTAAHPATWLAGFPATRLSDCPGWG
jgi:hypothetical protein